MPRPRTPTPPPVPSNWGIDALIGLAAATICAILALALIICLV